MSDDDLVDWNTHVEPPPAPSRQATITFARGADPVSEPEPAPVPAAELDELERRLAMSWVLRLTARLRFVESALAFARKPFLAESDLIEFYKARMAEHGDAAIASRQRAEAAESALAAERARADLATAQRDTFAALHETERERAEKAEAERERLAAAERRLSRDGGVG